MNITTQQLNEILARKAIARRNPAGSAPHGSEPERLVRNEPVATPQRENQHASRYAVRVISRRERLLDPDNLIPKYFLDSLRYAGLLPDDRPDIIELTVTQEKVRTKEECCTLIEIEPLTTAQPSR